MNANRVEHPLIFNILQSLLRKNETVRVDLQHPGGRRSGILSAIEFYEGSAPIPPRGQYRLTYEYNFDLHDRSDFTAEELEHHAFIKQSSPLIWELRINHAKKTELYGLGPI